MIQVQLKLKSFDSYYINANLEFIQSLLKFLNIEKSSQISFPSRIKKITVLRSPHIDKSSREQFQLQSHKKVLEINLSNQESAILLIKILKNTEFIGTQLEISMKFLDYFFKK